jgi:hypothetical protein
VKSAHYTLGHAGRHTHKGSGNFQERFPRAPSRIHPDGRLQSPAGSRRAAAGAVASCTAAQSVMGEPSSIARRGASCAPNGGPECPGDAARGNSRASPRRHSLDCTTRPSRWASFVQFSAECPAGTPHRSRSQRHFATAWNGFVAPVPSCTALPCRISLAMDPEASADGAQCQLRPSTISHSVNRPEGFRSPAVQNRTSPCARRARKRYRGPAASRPLHERRIQVPSWHCAV